MLHFEGEGGAGRLVRFDDANGEVTTHYEGEIWAERVVCVEIPGDKVDHFQGEWGAERLVRRVRPDGRVSHFKGAKGAARVWCASSNRTARCEAVRARRVSWSPSCPAGSSRDPPMLGTCLLFIAT